MNIHFAQLDYVYGPDAVALRGVELFIVAGEHVAIWGGNGAGKTTLGKQLNGLLRPTRGTVRVGDWDVRDHTVGQMAHRVGYLFQHPEDQLFAATLWDEVAFGPRNLGYEEQRVQTMVERSLAAVGLEQEASSHPYDLSLTQRRLLALASILAMDTPILVLDEPTVHLDALSMQRVIFILGALRERGKTVIALSHDGDFCAEHFPRLVLIHQGQILLDGPTGQVLQHRDILAAAGLETPQIARLAQALGLAGATTRRDLLRALAMKKR